MATVDLYFITAINQFSYPATDGPAATAYDFSQHPLIALPTIPTLWTAVGTPTFSSQGMAIDAGDYIEGTGIYGDILVDINIEGSSATGANRIVSYIGVDGSVVSVWIDFDIHEIWLDNVVGSLKQNFRPGIKDTHNTFFRFSVRYVNGEFIARLYASYEDSPEPPLLQQTAGPSTSQFLVNAGRLRVGNLSGPASFTIHSLQFKAWPTPGNTSPDSYYPFPQITSISPTNGQLSGGDRLRASSANFVDTTVGNELLFYGFSSNDISSGDASTSIAASSLLLNINSIGTAKRRFLNTYSGDRPSGTHLSFDLQADADIVASPPQIEVIVGAVEYGVDGVIYTIQMVASRSLGVVFRIVQQDGGITQLSQNVLTTTQANHTLEFIRGANVIILVVDGAQVLKSFIPDGPGVVKMYSTSTVMVNLTSTFTNFKVRPVLLIGDGVSTLI